MKPLVFVGVIFNLLVIQDSCVQLQAGHPNESGLQPADAVENAFEINQDDDGLTITLDGKLFARYVIGDVNKPYLWPTIGPTGKAMTRAYPMKMVDNESKAQRDHPHHRGLLFGHESAGLAGWKYPDDEEAWAKVLDKSRKVVGGDSWHEQATFDEYRKMSKLALDGQRRPATLASIRHIEFKKLDADDQKAIVVEVCDHVDRDMKPFLREERTLTFRATTETRMIDFDQTFTAKYGGAVFQDRKDSGLAIRVPASMAMKSQQGGKVVNSDWKIHQASLGQACQMV